MYTVTNTESHETRGFENRDQLIRFLEEQDAYCKGEGLSLELKLLQVDHDNGEILDNLVISLPLQRPADNLLLHFGRKKEPKKGLLNPFIRKGKDSSPKEPKEDSVLKEELPVASPELPEPSQPRPAEPVQKLGSRPKSILILFLALAVLALSAQSAVQYLALKDLKTEVQVLATKANQERQLDVFGRYFLSHYYSGNENTNLAPFVAEEVALAIKSQKASLTSAILEGVELSDDGTYQLTYILTIRDGETAKQETFEMTVKPDKSSSHGYLVVAPSLTLPYPNTRK